MYITKECDLVMDAISKIEYLEKLINVVQQNVNFSLGLTWAILGVVIAAIGVAVYFLVKVWFDSRFKEESEKIDIKIKNYIRDNPQLMWANGTCGIVFDDSKKNERCYFINGLKDFKFENMIYLDLFYETNNKKVSINAKNIQPSANGIGFVASTEYELTNYNLNFFILWKSSFYN